MATPIKTYAVQHPLSEGFVATINRKVVFADETLEFENPQPVGSEVTLTFVNQPRPLRYNEARQVAKLIHGTVVRVS
jgi:hypothetical protein